MTTAYSHITARQQKTWIIVVLFPICYSILTYLVLLAGHQIWLSLLSEQSVQQMQQTLYPASPLFYYTNKMAVRFIPLLAGVLILWLVTAYIWGADIMINKAQATEITPENDRNLYRLVENLCVTRGLPVPKIYVMQDTAMNAFATGRNVEKAVIVLTSGLLENLKKSELQGVVAHELAHIENRDITLMLMIIEGIAFFTFFGEALVQSGWFGRFFIKSIGAAGNRNLEAAGVTALVVFIITFIISMIGMAFIIFGCLVAPILRFATSRQREYLADATAALTTRNPEALISALEKISQNSNTKVLRKHPSMAAMCIESPQEVSVSLFSRLSGLYASHPPIEERIKRLKQMAGMARK